MSDQGDRPDRRPADEPDREPGDELENELDPSAWARLRGWAIEHRMPLVALGIGLTAAAAVFGVRARVAGGPRSVAESAAAVAKAAADAAAAASSRVAGEFEALGKDYKMAAMDLTVGSAIRRHQRWTQEELAVLADTSKTAVDKALELQRTFNGVMAKAIWEGFSSKAP